jgi:hypothetical protein
MRRRRNSRRMSAQHWKPPRAATLKMRWTGAGSEDEEEDKEAEEEKEEDRPPKGPLDACPEPPPLKRLRTKGPRPLLELGWKAMIGVADYTSRFATELGCPVYCFAFENTTYKPAAFRRYLLSIDFNLLSFFNKGLIRHLII